MDQSVNEVYGRQLKLAGAFIFAASERREPIDIVVIIAGVDHSIRLDPNDPRAKAFIENLSEDLLGLGLAVEADAPKNDTVKRMRSGRALVPVGLVLNGARMRVPPKRR